MLKACFFLFGIFAANESHARVFYPVIQIGIDGGGESLRDQSDQSDFDLNAGTGLFISGGTIVRVSDTNPHAFEAQITVAYKGNWDTDEDKGDVNWKSIPLELMSFYKNKRNGFRLGYGASYYMSSRLEGDGGRSDINRKYENRFGYILALEKMVENHRDDGMLSYGVRYNIRDFVPKGGGSKKSGDAFGLFMTISFPQWDSK